jgi:hypothetical protein
MSNDQAVPENLNPVQLPGRYWSLIDFGVLSLDEAKAAWAEEEKQGVPFDPLG